MPGTAQPVRQLGLRSNLPQFSLLVVVNAFVGAMVGLERTVLPLLAEREFALGSHIAMLSFITTFGLTKALVNFFAGRLSDQIGRKRLLVLGWLFGLPVPLLLIWAPSWSWVIGANVLLGLNQGLAWSMTVIMKIDLVGPRRRGLAMGWNEFAGYLAVALSAFLTGYIAESFGLRPEPFYLGIGFAALGLLLSAAFVEETKGHVALELQGEPNARQVPSGAKEILIRTSWSDPALFSCSQAGAVNNLNDGLAWGLFPLFFASGGLSVSEIGILAALYPAVWGVGQLGTGALSDHWGRKPLIVSGMLLQAAALAVIPLAGSFVFWAAGAILLGLGTAMVYPTLLASVSDVAHPSWRGSAVGTYRLWRDCGYAAGAVLAGILADLFGISSAILLVAGLTALSGIVVAHYLPETRPLSERESICEEKPHHSPSDLR